ncbi:MAG: T9SS type A sorting domain-containing protein [Balneolaceae bacterium]|nr:T9SS type A sorting domain-containing protein [Balneolaceae bacterium]
MPFYGIVTIEKSNTHLSKYYHQRTAINTMNQFKRALMKILSTKILTSVVLFVSLFMMNSVAMAQIELSFGGNISGDPGDTVEVVVTTSDLTGLDISSFDFEIEFDSSLISVVKDDIERGDLVNSITKNVTSDNRIKVAFASSNDISGAGSLFSFTGTLKGQGGNASGLKVTEILMGDNSQTITPEVPHSIAIEVAVVNEAPSFETTLPDTTIDEGQQLNFTYAATDPNGADVVAFSIVDGPEGALIGGSSGEFSFTPDFTQAGTHMVVIGITDGKISEPVKDTTIVTVENVNRAPVFGQTLPDTTIDEGEQLSFMYTAADEDTDDELTFSLVDGPSGAAVNSSTGEFTFTPGPEQAGTYNITVSVTDSNIETPITTSSTLTVEDANLPPSFTVTLPDTSIVEGDTLTFTYEATDEEEDTPSFSIESGPAGASINAETGELSYPTTLEDAGSYELIVGVTDDVSGNTTTTTASITVMNLEDDVSITEVKNLADGTPVLITGIVTSPGLGSGENAYYIQAGTSGIRVELGAAKAVNAAPALESGMEVEVQGTTSTDNGESVVSNSTAEVLSEGNTLPDPVLITSLDMWSTDSDLTGAYVTLENITLLDDQPWPTTALDEGETSVTVLVQGNLDHISDTFAIQINKGTALDGTEEPAGAFSLSGVMQVNGEDVQLLPFYAEDKGVATSIEDDPLTDKPSDYRLDNNYPNPFNPTTNIRYSIPEASFVTIEVFNVVGKKIKTLVRAQKSAGTYTVTFDASNMSSGIYIYRLRAADYVSTRRMTLIK